MMRLRPISTYFLKTTITVPALVALSACGGGDPGESITEAAAQYGIQMVNADDVHALGGTGAGVRVAVVDTGINASHPEFVRRGVTGRNFVDGESILNWDEDNAGHGTAVAGVIGAALDGEGMFGIAYESELYAYRIDSGGNPGFEGVDTDADFEEVIRRHILDNIDISNNSWDFVCHMDNDNGCVSSILTQNFEDTVVDAYIDAANLGSDEGTVFVWAAGNLGPGEGGSVEDFDTPNLLAGLPDFYPVLEDNWVAVMSVDESGTESEFSYRCGEAWEWCVAAPGESIFTTDAGGGYATVDGTSFAAPMVAGVLAILVDQLSITAEQALVRVKTTADYDGLTTFDGCTLASCGVSAMRDVFGLGLVDALAAQQVMGTLSVPVTGASEGRSVASMSAPAGLSARGRAALAEAQVVALDSFDGATFRIRGDEVFTDTESDFRSIGYLQRGGDQGLFANEVAPEKTERLSLAHVYGPQGLSAASYDFWGDKIGLVKDLGEERLHTDSVQLAYALTDALTLSGSVDYSDVTDEAGFGFAAALKLGERTRLMGGFSRGAYVEDMTGLDANNMTLGEATSYEIGLRHALTDRIELFGQAEMRDVADISASTTRWGTRDARYGSAVMGAEYSGDSYKVSAGLYHPDQQIDGDATIYLASGKDLSGRVFYSEAAFDARGEGDLGLFLAGKWDFLADGMGEVAFQLQQAPGEVEKVDKAAVMVNLRF